MKVSETPDSRPLNSVDGSTATWNRGEVLDRLGGDEDLLRELSAIFLEESPKLVDKLRTAMAGGDCEAVMQVAHSIKGEAGYLGAGTACKAAGRLEGMGREKDLGAAPEIFALLERELGNTYIAIKDSVGAKQ